MIDLHKYQLRKRYNMSDDLQKKIDELQKENVNLKTRMNQNQEGVNNLIAQLEAHKGMVNDGLNFQVQARTQLVLLQKKIQELNAENDSLKKQVEALNQTKVVNDVPAMVPAN